MSPKYIYLSSPRAPKVNFFEKYMKNKKFIPGPGAYKNSEKAREMIGI